MVLGDSSDNSQFHRRNYRGNRPAISPELGADHAVGRGRAGCIAGPLGHRAGRVYLVDPAQIDTNQIGGIIRASELKGNPWPGEVQYQLNVISTCQLADAIILQLQNLHGRLSTNLQH